MDLSPDEINALARKPFTVTTDAGTSTQRTGQDLKALADLVGDASLAGDNPAGGAKSAWRQVRLARSIPPGPV